MGEGWVDRSVHSFPEHENISTMWQIVEVNRPLMSVHQICQKGNICVFAEHGGYVMNLNDGATTHFGVEDNVYVMELFLPPSKSGAEGFPRQGAR